MDKLAIEVTDLYIGYKEYSSVSIRKQLFSGWKHKDFFYAINGISFSVKKGEIFGIIGKNGSGKSTLLRAIAGVFSANGGTMNLFDNSVSLMALGVGFNYEMTGYENIMLSGMLKGFSKAQVKEQMQNIIEFSELGEYIYKPVKTYSSGMYSKLSFSIEMFLDTDILLVDEVLSVGDREFKQKSLAKMRELIHRDDKTVILVSHEVSTMQQLCDRIMWIDSGKCKMIGNADEVMQAYIK